MLKGVCHFHLKELSDDNVKEREATRNQILESLDSIYTKMSIFAMNN